MPEETRELQDLGWCIVEVAGHRKLGAQVREVLFAGAVMARCEIPGTATQPGWTQLYGGSFLFCVTPTTEEIARSVAARYAEPPVSRYDPPARLPPAQAADPPDWDDDAEDQRSRAYEQGRRAAREDERSRVGAALLEEFKDAKWMSAETFREAVQRLCSPALDVEWPDPPEEPIAVPLEPAHAAPEPLDPAPEQPMNEDDFPF